MIEQLLSGAGLLLFILTGVLLSENRRAINIRLVLWGVALQFLFALVILKTAVGYVVFDVARLVMTQLLNFTDIGAGFLFGRLVDDPSMGAIVAFKVLPTIIFVSSLMAVLYHYGILQAIIRGMAWVMRRTMQATGIEAFISSAFVFMGIEAITGVKSYIERMTRSELFCLMTGFMATIAGSVMAAYVSFGADAGHLLAASVMSAPASIVMAKLIVPETSPSTTDNISTVDIESDDANTIEALATGATEGLKLALTIGAMLIAFVSVIGMLDSLLGQLGTSFGDITGYLFSPVAFIMGVPWEESVEVGRLLGIKVIFNEFISYQMLQGYIEDGSLSPRSVVIATYALCSFANFGSLAILIGGIGGLVPRRKKEVSRLGLKALLAGTLAGFMTATIAGILL